ncbi:uncharacterized protein LOC136026103 [Artemia franciscana]|uniref:uncharacterized protein LOC136026103 n=1 Tax=Artemia franciscana TaxID=6661 RepID=UPI0032DA263B
MSYRIPVKRILTVALLLSTFGCDAALKKKKYIKGGQILQRMSVGRHIGDQRPQISQTKKEGESAIYYIRLPPQPYFYNDFNEFDSSYTKKRTLNKIGLSFSSNGKPKQVYHWNLPLLKTTPLPFEMITKKKHKLITAESTTTTTTTESTSVPNIAEVRRPAYEDKKRTLLRKQFYNNGKASSIYFIPNKFKPKFYGKYFRY